MGDVIGDLNKRRGKILGQESHKGGVVKVHAEVPLSEMFGYTTSLRSLSSGRATYDDGASLFRKGSAEDSR